MTRSGVIRLAELLGAARRTVVLTGAGVSTESGIPDFRSPGGVWDRFGAAELSYGHFMASREGQRRYWQVGRAIYPLIRDAVPNPAHRAIADLHRLGRLDCCITQNIDDLHRRAGLPEDKLIEVHGNATRARCLACGAGYRRDDVHSWLGDDREIPSCPRCGGTIKPHTVLFGEPMPARAMLEAEARARACDLFVVVGSSLGVYPAAYLPAHAVHAGAALAIVNLTATPCDARAELVVRGKAGEVMAGVVDELSPARSAERGSDDR